jgi:hypothetical protein
LHSPFSSPCASRGKLGTSHPTHNLVFQIRSFAQPCFRKLTPYATSSPQTSSPFFPLFLRQLRVLLSFFLIFTAFLTTRRSALQTSLPPSSHIPLASSATHIPFSAPTPLESRQPPCFPPTREHCG